MIARSMLAHRLSQDEIKEICVLAHGKHNDRVSGNLVGISINLCKSIQKELFINDTP